MIKTWKVIKIHVQENVLTKIFFTIKAVKMVIITKSRLHEYAAEYPDLRDSIDEWYRKTKDADWSSFHDIKETFNSVDYAGNDRYVFNIKGKKYRLVALIHFDRRTLYIRFLGTHKEYDAIDCSII